MQQSTTHTQYSQTKQQTLKDIANDLRTFDFNSFDPRKDKIKLMNHLQMVNSKLGRMIRKLNVEKSGER